MGRPHDVLLRRSFRACSWPPVAQLTPYAASSQVSASDRRITSLLAWTWHALRPMGLLLPKPVIGAACHGPELSDLRGIVRERPLLFAADDDDGCSPATCPPAIPCLHNPLTVSGTVRGVGQVGSPLRYGALVSGLVGVSRGCQPAPPSRKRLQVPLASSSRSQVTVSAVSTASCLTWGRPSISIRRRLPLAGAIVTRLATRSPANVAAMLAAPLVLML